MLSRLFIFFHCTFVQCEIMSDGDGEKEHTRNTLPCCWADGGQ